MLPSRRILSLSQTRYRPYNALLSPVRALQRLVSQSLSSPSSSLTNNERFGTPNSTATSITPIEGKDVSSASSTPAEGESTSKLEGSIEHKHLLTDQNPSELPSNRELQPLVKESHDTLERASDIDMEVVTPARVQEGGPATLVETNVEDVEMVDAAPSVMRDEENKSQAAVESAVVWIDDTNSEGYFSTSEDDTSSEGYVSTSEDEELTDVNTAEEGEIIDVNPEPVTRSSINAFLGSCPTMYRDARDRCLHWLGRMAGEEMEEDCLYEKTWRTECWSMHSFVAIRGIRIYHFFDRIHSGYVTYSPPLRYGPNSRWNFYPEHVNSGTNNTFERTSGDIEFWVDGDKFKYYVWTHLHCGGEILIDAEIGTPHPDIPGYFLHHHYNQPPMWLHQAKPRPPVDLTILRSR